MGAKLENPPFKGFTSRNFSKQLASLRLFGISLSDNESIGYKIYSAVFLVFGFFSYTVLDFFEMFKHDFETTSEIIIYVMAGFISINKTLSVIWNRDKLRNLVVKLEREPFLPNAERGGEEEEKLIKEANWISTAQTYIYWIFSSVTVSGTILFTVYKRIASSDYRDWKFAYGPFTYLNVTYSPNYEICWIYQNISVTFMAANFTTVDLFIGAVLVHCCYQFKILQNCIRNLVQTSHDLMIKDASGSLCNRNTCPVEGSTVPLNYLNASLKRAVRYHLALLEITEEMEEAFSKPLMITFLGTLCLECFCVFQASKVNNGFLLVMHVGQAVTTIMQVLLSCYWGEQIVQESGKVGLAAYESNFVGTDLRFQKGLALIIRRSQNPSRLTAGKFADIGLTTFVWILRTSYSSFMILRRQNS